MTSCACYEALIMMVNFLEGKVEKQLLANFVFAMGENHVGFHEASIKIGKK